MIEIPAQYHQQLARLLAVMLVTAVAALVLLRRVDPAARRRTLARAALVGALCAALSAVLYTSRGAGTGTQTSWGWPRTVFSLWQSWETGERTHGIRWRGLLENAAFYGVLAAVSGGLLARRRAASMRRAR